MEAVQAPRPVDVPRMLLGLVDRPADTFRRLARGARWVWLVPLVLLLVGQLVFTIVAAEPTQAFSREVTRYTLEHGSFASQMTPEQRRQALEQAEAQGGGGPLFLVIGVGGAILFTAAGWVIQGLVFHGLAMLMGSKTSTPGGMIAMASWAWLPFWLRQIVQTLFVAQTGELPRHEGLSFLVTTGDRVLDSFNPLYVYLGQLDLWQVANWVLLTIGVSVLAGISRGRAAVMVLALWIVSSLIAIAPVLLSKAFVGL